MRRKVEAWLKAVASFNFRVPEVSRHCSFRFEDDRAERTRTKAVPGYAALLAGRSGYYVDGTEEILMAAKQVVLYFDSHTDALQFTLAASSAITGEKARDTNPDLNREIQRATRILVEDIATS
jgi:hypothetical protein